MKKAKYLAVGGAFTTHHILSGKPAPFLKACKKNERQRLKFQCSIGNFKSFYIL